jgi:hypothetical protein
MIAPKICEEVVEKGAGQRPMEDGSGEIEWKAQSE